MLSTDESIPSFMVCGETHVPETALFNALLATRYNAATSDSSDLKEMKESSANFDLYMWNHSFSDGDPTHPQYPGIVQDESITLAPISINTATNNAYGVFVRAYLNRLLGHVFKNWTFEGTYLQMTDTNVVVFGLFPPPAGRFYTTAFSSYWNSIMRCYITLCVTFMYGLTKSVEGAGSPMVCQAIDKFTADLRPLSTIVPGSLTVPPPQLPAIDLYRNILKFFESTVSSHSFACLSSQTLSSQKLAFVKSLSTKILVRRLISDHAGNFIEYLGVIDPSQVPVPVAVPLVQPSPIVFHDPPPFQSADSITIPNPSAPINID